MVAKSILVVDDDASVAQVLCDGLRREGYSCAQVSNGQRALESVQESPPDLILLDRMLPGLPGDEVMVRLKGDPLSREIPVIMLTGKVDEADQVIGLGLGADDYVTKPFSMKLLVARIAAKLRQKTPDAMPCDDMVVKSLTLDRTQLRVFIDKTPVALSTTEHRILGALIAARGHVLHRRQLITMVFGDQPDAGDDAIDSRISELRRKLGPAAGCVQQVTAESYAFCYPSGARTQA